MTARAGRPLPLGLLLVAVLAGAMVAVAQDADRLAPTPGGEQVFRSQIIGGTPDWRRAPGDRIQWRVEEVTPSGESRIRFETSDPLRFDGAGDSFAGRPDPRPVRMFGIDF